jgi:8-oxo-dGTP diphosphatase
MYHKRKGLILKEHEVVKWLASDELETVDWLPADIELVRKLGAFKLKMY